MSSDSGSFTSHSGSIEKQLDSALETAQLLGASNPRPVGDADDGREIGATAGSQLSGCFDADSSLEDEDQDHQGEAAAAAADADKPTIDGGEDDDPGPRRRRLHSGENLGDGARRTGETSQGNERASGTDWGINSPYVEPARPEGREFELRSLSRQLCKKSARRGFDFKLMLVGESGIGKTTLIDSLFNVESTRNLGSQFVRSQRDVATATKLCERFFELEEGGISVRLTVIDTPGFATELDSSGCVQPVLSYVERQLDEYYRLEQGTDRSKLHDSRVHALIYMISPSSRGLKPVDLMCLKALQSRVNIVPVIGKADSLTPGERSGLKASILQDLNRHGVCVYALPEFDDCFGGPDQTGDEFYLRNQYESLRNSMPLAVVGSNLLVRGADGQRIRAREYPWGVVDIENPEYSDFLKLRELLIMYMEDFKDRTHEVIYEQLRLNRLRQTDWQMSRMSKTLVERDRLLREKEDELHRLRVAVEDLQRANTSSNHGTAKSSSLPVQAAPGPQSDQFAASSSTAAAASRTHASYGGGRQLSVYGRSASGRDRRSQYD